MPRLLLLMFSLAAPMPAAAAKAVPAARVSVTPVQLARALKAQLPGVQWAVPHPKALGVALDAHSRGPEPAQLFAAGSLSAALLEPEAAASLAAVLRQASPAEEPTLGWGVANQVLKLAEEYKDPAKREELRGSLGMLRSRLAAAKLGQSPLELKDQLDGLFIGELVPRSSAPTEDPPGGGAGVYAGAAGGGSSRPGASLQPATPRKSIVRSALAAIGIGRAVPAPEAPEPAPDFAGAKSEHLNSLVSAGRSGAADAAAGRARKGPALNIRIPRARGVDAQDELVRAAKLLDAAREPSNSTLLALQMTPEHSEWTLSFDSLAPARRAFEKLRASSPALDIEAPAAVTAPPEHRVFSMLNQSGSFETKPIPGRPGWRTFGFWSFEGPKAGDVLVKLNNDGSGNLVVYRLETFEDKPFKGSNGDRFWRGEMRDIVGTGEFARDSALANAVDRQVRSQGWRPPGER